MKNTIQVTKPAMPKFEDYIEEIKDLWESGWLTNSGLKHQELEKKLSEYLKTQNLELIVNGHMAIEIALESLGVQGEVITTPFTFISTTQAIVRTGNVPIFCDINTIDFNIDVNKIEELITNKTVAIMPVHVYGNVCDVAKIDEIAKKHKLKVIYDAAHTFGVEYNGKGIASFGDLSCFSFHATKVFNTAEGGGISVNNNDYLDKIRLLRRFGMKNEDEVTKIGTNAKMHEFSAAMGLCNLKYIDDNILKRQIITNQYKENLKDIKGLQFNPIQEGVKSNYAYFPVVFDETVLGFTRDDVLKNLASKNIIARKYFYPLTSEMECYSSFAKGNTPIAKSISDRVLTLPIYPDLGIEVVDRVCEIIRLR